MTDINSKITVITPYNNVVNANQIFGGLEIKTITLDEWIHSLPHGVEIKKIRGALFCKYTNEMYWIGDSHDRL